MAKECGSCGEAIDKAKRTENGVAYCDGCYYFMFPLRQCEFCSEKRRICKLDKTPVCRQCRLKDLICSRCEKKIQRASRRIKGRALCGSCANLFGQEFACECCGKIGNKYYRKSDKGKSIRICDSCYRKYKHVNCKHCGKNRLASEMNSQVCKYCDQNELPFHDCPDCGSAVPGAGSYRCEKCDYRKRCEQRVALNSEIFECDFIRERFRIAANIFVTQHKTGKIVEKLDELSTIFVRLERRRSAIDEEALIGVLDSNTTKSKSLFLQVLFQAYGFQWNEQIYQDFKEKRRIQDLLHRSSQECFWDIMDGYWKYLSTSSTRYKMKTLRVYMSCALHLVTAVFSDGIVDSSKQKKVANFLIRSPGLRSSLRVFINYLEINYGIRYSKSSSRRSSDKKLDRGLRFSVTKFSRRLEASEKSAEIRALSAKLISLLYGIPLNKILATKVSEYEKSVETISWFVEDEIIHLEPLISKKIIDTFYSDAKTYLFFGQQLDKPLSESSVAYWTK